ncbi:hypothetical protein EC973_008249 [Apophysomyces ossiformis]|uniref:RRM domain-containing protein n=1 Tax=Apophysomyces ossiformis TaxID=679940 RepID=A0A8H7C0I3_9FUNG|nr:hypothetical protein EC973_008249 [Apophysomyces ossiformis]
MSNIPNDPAKTLYVGNLDQRVTDVMLHDIFAMLGTVVNVKIVAIRRHGPYESVNYGFVEFAETQGAEQALQQMNGRKIFNYVSITRDISVFGGLTWSWQEIKVNWAQQGAQAKDDTANHFHVFVGDLAPEITDDTLARAFSGFETMSEAHVMWDSVSGKSRGFGFVAFRDKTDAEQAIATMNGEWLGSRTIRCNWATQKGQMATPPPQPGQQLPYDIVVQQTPAYVTSIYVGNLSPAVSQTDLVQPFQRFGFVQEVKLQSDRGFAFVKLDTHENAANAIVHLQGFEISGRPVKLSWGKDRPPAGWQQQPYGGGYQAQQNWHHHGNTGHPGLYSGRVTRGGAYQQNGYAMNAASPSSLAILDPITNGTQGPAAVSQWGQQTAQQQLYDQYNPNPSDI